MRWAAITLCLWTLSGCGGPAEELEEPAYGFGSLLGPIPPAPPGARYFPEEAVWHRDVSEAPLDRESAQVIAGLTNMGGFGIGAIVVDFEIVVLTADETTPFLPFSQTSNFYSPDCDFAPVPVPPDGVLESEAGLACTTGRDCHLIVHHFPTSKLYEMWKADIRPGSFQGGCLAIWDLARVYGPWGRGQGCTSADAAGFPIAPLLFSADEVARGEIPHAIRMVLPNDRIRKRTYLAPGSHSTGSTKGGPDTPPFGARFRLRRDFPVDLLPNEGARVVARALQRYGMFLADGGQKALTAQNDRFTQAKWGTGDTRLLGENDLALLRVTDFEMVHGGARKPFAGECVREP